VRVVLFRCRDEISGPERQEARDRFLSLAATPSEGDRN